MAKALMKVIMKLVNSALGIVLSPVNLLISNLFPNFSQIITNFNNFINLYFGSFLSYFFNILPPILRTEISLILTFYVAYFGIIWTYRGITLIFEIIRKVKFW